MFVPGENVAYLLYWVFMIVIAVRRETNCYDKMGAT